MEKLAKRLDRVLTRLEEGMGDVDLAANDIRDYFLSKNGKMTKQELQKVLVRLSRKYTNSIVNTAWASLVDKKQKGGAYAKEVDGEWVWDN
jgi:hypothetical protein